VSDPLRAEAWIVATGNAGKLAEMRALLGDLPLALRSLADLPRIELPPEGDDYAANAVAKARAVALATGLPALGDDSGLEVDALSGRPGVHSARYGGPGRDDAARVALLLHELATVQKEQRSARFVCVVALVTPDGDSVTARGSCEGRILAAPRGEGGFGYDPVFAPEGRNVSLAELRADEKNRLSHRGRAVAALRAKLRAAERPWRTRVLLIRHGESTWNVAGRWQGWGDPPLSAYGRAQAAVLAEQLVPEGIVGLVSSDLARAAQTAQILGDALGLVPALDARLRERDLGRWSGLTEAEILAAFPDELARFRAREPGVRPGGGESRDEFVSRVAPALRGLAGEAGAGALAIVTHLGVIRLIAPELRPGNAEVVAVDHARLLTLASDP
jgi:XTP/dITP diphosphohydrolase